MFQIMIFVYELLYYFCFSFTFLTLSVTALFCVYELVYYELLLNLGAIVLFCFLVQYKKVDTKHVYVL